MRMRALVLSIGLAAGLTPASAYAPLPGALEHGVPGLAMAALPMVSRCNLQPAERTQTAADVVLNDFRQFSMLLGPGICLLATVDPEPDRPPELSYGPPLGRVRTGPRSGQSGSGPAAGGSISSGSFGAAGTGPSGAGGGAGNPLLGPGSSFPGTVLPYPERGRLPGGVHSNPIPGRPTPVPGPVAGAGLPVLVASAVYAVWRRARAKRNSLQ
jgi:hypothetical protein